MNILHIIKPKDGGELPGCRDSAYSWSAYCGHKFKAFESFLADPEHAKGCIDRESYVQPCKKCYSIIRKEIEKNNQ